ncbi:MAG: gamma-glutamyl-gamma-aminobutyrate hydrolase family protein, partial [Mariprofundales bacterium]
SAARHTGPTFGVCFGHQLIAYALFGETAVQRSQTPEYGWKDIELCFDDAPLTRAVKQANALTTGSGTSFRCFTSHKDEIVPHFPGCQALRVTARSATCAVEAFEHRTLPMTGIQFHPELPQAVCTDLLGLRTAQQPELGLDLAFELGRRTNMAALWQELRAAAFGTKRRAA